MTEHHLVTIRLRLHYLGAALKVPQIKLEYSTLSSASVDMLVVVVVELTVFTELLLQIRFLVLFSSLRNSPSSDEFVSDPPVESCPPFFRSLQVSTLCNLQSVTGLSGPEFSEPDDTPDDVSGLFGPLFCLDFHFVFMPRSKLCFIPDSVLLFKPCILSMIPSIYL